jgi:hypothetical protein
MRTSKFIFQLIIFLIPLTLSAQYSDFDLSRYKLPDIKLNRLDANLYLSNAANSDHFRSSYTDSTESVNNNFLGSVNLDYYHFRNTEKYQGDLDISLVAHTSPYKFENDNISTSTNTYDENVSVRSTNRFYNQRLNFLEVDPQAFVNKNVYKSYYEYPGNTSQKQCNDQYLTSLSMPVSVGHGRIEPVEDLRLAIYILEELNKVGRIDSLPSDNVILDMAKEISRIKRQRFFDSRIRKIRELQVIDSFLVANRIVSPNDITYFAVLNDQWDYASGPVRSAGFAINAGIDDHFNFNYANQAISVNGAEPSKIIITTNTYYVAAFFQARYYKPVNLHWQTSATFLTSYGIEFTRDPKEKSNPDENFETNIYSASIGYSIQYLPNSRTSARFGLSGNYQNSRGDRTISNPDPIKMRDNQFIMNASLDMYYYISPQFRIQLNSNLSYYARNTLNSNNTQPDLKELTNIFHHDFSLTLIYSFF